MKYDALILLLILFSKSAVHAQQNRMDRFNSFKWVNPPTEEVAWAEQEGILHKTFYSKANKSDIGYFIQFPRGYNASENQNRSYPVIYYLHSGFTGSEQQSLMGFRNMGDFLNSPDYPEVFMVGVNGGQFSHRDYNEYKGYRAFLEFVDHIDDSYRTLQSREGRALLGYSFGAPPVARHLLKHPDLFQTGVALDGSFTRDRQTQESKGTSYRFKITNWQNNAYTNAAEYAARENKPPIKLMVVVGGDSRNYPGTLHWAIHLHELAIKHQLVIVPNAPWHSGLGAGNGWQVENTGERIYRFIAEGLENAADN